MFYRYYFHQRDPQYSSSIELDNIQHKACSAEAQTLSYKAVIVRRATVPVRSMAGYRTGQVDGHLAEVFVALVGVMVPHGHPQTGEPQRVRLHLGVHHRLVPLRHRLVREVARRPDVLSAGPAATHRHRTAQLLFDGIWTMHTRYIFFLQNTD